MVTDTKRDRITEWAREALLAMRQRQIPPTPENFAIWYEVASGAQPSLTRLVQVVEEQELPFDDARNREIYDHFFSQDREREAVTGIGDRVEQHLRAIGDLVGQIVDGTRAYGTAIDGVVDAMPTDGGNCDLRHALGTLRAGTERILERADRWGNAASAQSTEISKLKSDLAAARNEAETDGLTRIGNRKRFDRRLLELATAACSDQTPLCLILLDVDHFKLFNDTYGHTLGDRVLKIVAKRIQQVLPAPIEVFRYGGEEFAVIAPAKALGDAVDVAEVARKAVAAIRIARKSDSEPLRQVTVSLGVSQYAHGEGLQHLIDRADTALYGAKNSGRNCTSIKRTSPKAA